MKKFAKNMLAMALAAVLAVSMLAGCSTSIKPENYASTAVATYGDQKIYLDEANMYLRAEQYYYEYIYTYMYGMTDIWNMEVETGVTMAASLRESVMSVLRQTYILCDQADELNVTLTAEDQAKVEKAVDEILEGTSDALLESYNLSRERMIEIYQKNALANRVWEALVADTDTNVADEDARCVGVSYVLVSETTSDTEEGKLNARPAKTRAQEIYDAVKGGAKLADAAKEQELTVTENAYFVGDEYEENTLGAKAIAMTTEGAVEIFQLEEGKGWYVMVLDALTDEDATENKRASIISSRQAEVFNKKYEELQKNSAAFTVDEKVWKSLPMTTVFEVPEQTTAAETTAAETTAAETTAAAN